MIELFIEKEHEGVARLRWTKITRFMEIVSRKIRRYEAGDGNTYRIVYSLDRYIGWHAQLMINDVSLCRFEYPESWFTSRFHDKIRDANDNPIEDERVFISEFYEFVEDYKEEE